MAYFKVLSWHAPTVNDENHGSSHWNSAPTKLWTIHKSYHLNQPVKQGKQNDLKTPRPHENLRTYPHQWPPCTVIYLRYRSVSVLSDQTPCDYNLTSVISYPLFMKKVERNAAEWHNQASEDNNQATTNMLTCHRQVKFWKLESTKVYMKYNDSYGQMNFKWSKD